MTIAAGVKKLGGGGYTFFLKKYVHAAKVDLQKNLNSTTPT